MKKATVQKSILRGLGISLGLLVLTAMAEPLPSDGEYEAREAGTIPRDINKVVKVQFNRIYQTTRMENGMYTAEIRSTESPSDTHIPHPESGNYLQLYSDKPGLTIQFPVEGLDFFLKCFSMPERGPHINSLLAQNRDVYIQISNTTGLVFTAIGDVCKKDGDEAEYSWSVKTKIPDLTQKKKIFIRDVLLFTDQLKGRIIEVEFYVVGMMYSKVYKMEERTDGTYVTMISDGQCTVAVPVRIPPEAVDFFKKLAKGGHYHNAIFSIYAEVMVSENGNITLEAKGLRRSGSGDHTKYRW